MSRRSKLRPRTYIVYDGRAWIGNADDAAVLEYIGERPKIPWREVRKDWGGQGVQLYSYRRVEGNKLVDERHEGVI